MRRKARLSTEAPEESVPEAEAARKARVSREARMESATAQQKWLHHRIDKINASEVSREQASLPGSFPRGSRLGRASREARQSKEQYVPRASLLNQLANSLSVSATSSTAIALAAGEGDDSAMASPPPSPPPAMAQQAAGIHASSRQKMMALLSSALGVP